MTLEHVAIWSADIDRLKGYYCRYFGGVANKPYHNTTRNFTSYFLRFGNGARLELMQQPGIPANGNDTVAQHLGLIHLAFAVDTLQEVDAKALELQQAGFLVLKGPRKTGDGYYEFETLDPDGNRLEVTCNYPI